MSLVLVSYDEVGLSMTVRPIVLYTLLLHSCSKVVTRKSQEKLGISIMDGPPTLKDDMSP